MDWEPDFYHFGEMPDCRLLTLECTKSSHPGCVVMRLSNIDNKDGTKPHKIDEHTGEEFQVVLKVTEVPDSQRDLNNLMLPEFNAAKSNVIEFLSDGEENADEEKEDVEETEAGRDPLQ